MLKDFRRVKKGGGWVCVCTHALISSDAVLLHPVAVRSIERRWCARPSRPEEAFEFQHNKPIYANGRFFFSLTDAHCADG